MICLAVSYLATFIATAWWKKRAKRARITGIDMHKKGKKLIPEIGGVPVLFGFLLGILIYMGYRTFINGSTDFNIEILGVIGAMAIVGIIGIMDDILGWKLGLRPYQKPILCLFAALPIVMTRVGNSVVTLPFVGTVDFGVVYFLVVIPIAISGAANAFNMIAGYNGLEAGMGVVILSTLGLIIWIDQGLGQVAMLAGVMVACLFAFLLYNFYPASIFPGDTLTFIVGTLIAAVSILGNTEKIALFLFIPYFLQFFLKSRGGWQIEGFCRPDPDGFLVVPTKKIYGVEHLIVRVKERLGRKTTELDVVLIIISFELILAAIVMLDVGFF